MPASGTGERQSLRQGYKVNRSIGCNLVDPERDTPDQYTVEAYSVLLPMYRRYGLRHVEFSHVTEIDEADAERLRELARNLGLGLWSIHSEHLNGNRNATEDYLAVQTRCARVARALGTPVFVCHIPNLPPYAQDIDRDQEILSRVADITDAHGLRLAIETGPPTEYVVALADRLNRPTVGVNLDTGHVVLRDEDPAESARLIGPRLVTTHLQDNFGVNDDHQAPGMGTIDWRALIRALRDIGYEGPFMVELTGEGNKAHRSVPELRTFDLDKEIVFAIAYLKHVLAQTAD